MDIQKIQNFIREDHTNLEGWFFPLDQLAFYELTALQERLNINGDICEVGVYKGKSLVFLSLLKRRDEKLLGFDTFEDDYLKITNHSLKLYGSPENVSLQKGLTSDISEEQLNKLFERVVRFLHIDAGHEYHEVLEQLQIFTPYVSDQCIIAMDDYQDREFPGVGAAVLDFSEIDRPRRFVPFLASGNKMFLCHMSLASIFQKALLVTPNFKDKCRLTRVKDFNILILQSKLPVASETIISQIDTLAFPIRSDRDISLNEKSYKYSQITFGKGK